MGRILSVNLAVPEPNPAKGVGITGINKRPVDHLVTVRAPGPRTTGLHSGLVGDQIFDVEHHGGDDQAVYAYAREDYDWWQARLSRRLSNGFFGDNMTTEDVDVNGAVIGERWRVGPTLVLQPTFGRIPCATFQHKMGVPRWVKTFTRANRPGAYLRVLVPGEVCSGDPVTVEDRPAHGVTIARAFRAYMTEPQVLPGLLEIDGLPDDLRETLTERLPRKRERERSDMSDDLSELRAQAARGDSDAVDQLVELAGERGDMDELWRLADAGSSDAVDELVQLAGERGDVETLRKLADRGSRDAADMLTELADEEQ